MSYLPRGLGHTLYYVLEVIMATTLPKIKPIQPIKPMVPKAPTPTAVGKPVGVPTPTPRATPVPVVSTQPTGQVKIKPVKSVPTEFPKFPTIQRSKGRYDLKQRMKKKAVFQNAARKSVAQQMRKSKSNRRKRLGGI